MSYATSLGKREICDADLEFVSERIKAFDFLSVREQSSCSMLEPRIDKQVKWVCDPVFLLDAEKYLKFAKPMIEDKYIVIYLSMGTELLEQVITKIKETTGYKVILLGGSYTRCSCDLHIKDMGPEDFISLIYYSEAVLSSSFHATAFSHILHKRFAAILPPKNGERIESLLSLSGLSDHVINTADDFSVLFEDIDFCEVDKRIEPFVAESKSFLLESVNNLLSR